MSASSSGEGFKYSIAIAVHSMCHPGLPTPKGDGQPGSLGR